MTSRCATYLLVVFVLSALLQVRCSKTQFDRQHSAAAQKNPSQVNMTIRVVDGKRRFAVSEPVRLETLYSSRPGIWRIEVLDKWNRSGVSDVLHVTDGRTVWDVTLGSSYICCNSRLVWLGSEPLRLPYRTESAASDLPWSENDPFITLKLPARPGKYRLYISSKRLFPGDVSGATYSLLGRDLTSDNIVAVEVVDK